MTDDDLQRERLLSYFNGYEAGKADAAKETCVVLTELADKASEESQRFWDLSHHDKGNSQAQLIAQAACGAFSEFAVLLRKARSAQPADTVTVRREVLEALDRAHGVIELANQCSGNRTVHLHTAEWLAEYAALTKDQP